MQPEAMATAISNPASHLFRMAKFPLQGRATRGLRRRSPGFLSNLRHTTAGCRQENQAATGQIGRPALKKDNRMFTALSAGNGGAGEKWPQGPSLDKIRIFL